mgnify:CR=1 FL=1
MGSAVSNFQQVMVFDSSSNLPQTFNELSAMLRLDIVEAFVADEVFHLIQPVQWCTDQNELIFSTAFIRVAQYFQKSISDAMRSLLRFNAFSFERSKLLFILKISSIVVSARFPVNISIVASLTLRASSLASAATTTFFPFTVVLIVSTPAKVAGRKMALTSVF